MDYGREAGLPRRVPDIGRPTNMTGMQLGVVRAVYPDLWRVDIEPQQGGRLHKARVMGSQLPPVHQDLVRCSYVIFTSVDGNAEDIICWPDTARRFLDKQRIWKDEEGKNSHTQEDVGEQEDAQGKDDEPERHYYHVHLKCERAGDITIRVTDDNRWIVESEAGDMIRYDQKKREVDILSPTIRLGSMEATRLEYTRGEHTWVIQPDIRLGTFDAEQQVILGNLWQTFYNQFVDLFNGHRHRQVQPGGGISGAPVQPTPKMQDDLLSDITRTTKEFPESKQVP